MRARLAAARALDVAAGLLLAGILAAFVHPWVRPEDLFIALVLVGGLRLLLRPLPVPAFAPRRMVAMGTIAYPLVFSFVNHRTPYQAFVLPFLVLAAITGSARLRVARPGALALLASLVLSSRTVNRFALYRWWPDADDRAAYRMLARVPAEAAVSAQDPYVPHLALRARVFVFPVGIEDSDHLLLNLASYPWPDLPGVTMARAGDGVEIVTGSGGGVYRYAVAADDGPHLLLRRR